MRTFLHVGAANRDGLEGYVHVEDAPAGTPVSISVPEAGLAATLNTDANGRAEFEIPAKNLSLWSPENSKLYNVQIEAGQDLLTDDIGFRDIHIDGTQILLNGKPVFLNGVNAHAEASDRTGRVDSDKDVEAIFGFLKDLNANFVRLCHYPHDQRMERMADRYGIMVWSEIPVWQHISYDKPSVYAKADAMLTEMIRHDRDKASVILWSVANETPDNSARTRFLDSLAAEAHKLDTTRLVTAALLQPQTPGQTKILTDPLAQALDVVGVNEYVGWYTYTPEEAENVKFELPQKPIIISEFGAEAKAGNHGPQDQRWTEEFQLNFYRHNFVMLSKVPQFRGFAPWVLTDFRSPTRNIPVLQDGYNRKGLISEDGKKKQAFFFIQRAYMDGTFGNAE